MLISINIVFTPDYVWNLLELILTIVFLVVGTGFFIKFYREHETAPKSLNQFDLGYAFLFWAITINQFVYLTDSIPDLLPNLHSYFSEGEFVLFLGVTDFYIKTQLIAMIILLLLTFTPIMQPIERYLKNKEKPKIYYVSIVALILSSIVFIFLFFINRYIAPGGLTGADILNKGQVETIGGQILNVVMIILTIYIVLITLVLIVSFIGIYLKLAIKSPGAMRTKALYIFIGVVTVFVGFFFWNLAKNEMEGWIILGGPITFLFGMVLLIIGFTRKIID
jgi:hypothetical protein